MSKPKKEHPEFDGSIFTPSRVTFAHPKIEGGTKECVLLSARNGNGEYDGWFGRGRVHLINGSSGAGKTTLIVDMLVKQRSAEYFLGHLGAGLSYLVIFADRGALSNQETLERMGYAGKGIPIRYLPIAASGHESATAILEIIESGKDAGAVPIPGTVFIEGADMLVEDANKAQFVVAFMKWMLSALLDLTSDSNIQFILATHSIELLTRYSQFVRDLNNIEN